MLLVHSRLQHRLAARAVSGFLGFLGENVFLSSESAAPPQSHSTPFQAFFLLTPQLQSDHDATKFIQADRHAAAYRKCYAAAYRQCWPSEPKKNLFSVFNKTISFPTSSPSLGLTSVRNHLMKPKQHLYACSENGRWKQKSRERGNDGEYSENIISGRLLSDSALPKPVQGQRAHNQLVNQFTTRSSDSYHNV